MFKKAIAITIVMVFGLAGLAVAENRYQDKANGFSIVFPDGWKTAKADNKPFVVIAQSPDGGESDP